MPPKAAGSPRGQRPPRGRGGRGRGRGAPAPRGGMQGGDRDGRPSIADNVRAIGVKRPGFGTAGRVIKVKMNSFETTVPNDTLFQYDVPPADLSKRLCLRIMAKLQEDKGDIFICPLLYDGRAIMFAKQRLNLGPNNSQEFSVVLDPPKGTRPPRVHKITISKVDAEINLDVLHEFVAGRYTQDSSVLMAEMALNIAIRMLPRKKYPSNSRSFFVPEGSAPLGAGLEVWRGYFQSIRPSIGRLLLNLDISSAAMYRQGPLIGVCLEFLRDTFRLRQWDIQLLSPARGLTDSFRRKLETFLKSVKITTNHTGKVQSVTILRVVNTPAASATFDHDKFGKITIAAYFKKQFNINLKHPDIVCVQVGKTSILPMELCTIVPGQFAKAELTPDQTKNMVEFATMKPDARFQSIRQGLSRLAYGQSEYVRECGITVSSETIEVDARILPEPRLQVFPDRDQRKANIIPGNGKWNMLNKRFYRPARISGFMVTVFEDERRFNQNTLGNMVKSFVDAARDFGVIIEDPVPYVSWAVDRSRSVTDILLQAGATYIADKKKKTGNPKHPGPSLILAVLPPNSQDLYNAVKRFGFIRMGIATQCLLSIKCNAAKHQYWANIMLKVNVKLDGTNFVPDMPILDVAKPTIIMGADAIHPAPGTKDKPSFTALVTSMDSMLCKYVASNGIQMESGKGSTEMIIDLQSMCLNGLTKWKMHQEVVEKKRSPPLRLFYFRDGVSEGEFDQVLKHELPKIQAACAQMKWSPKITVVIVGKRHHHRGEPSDPREGDQSFNVPAGSTIDTGIVHPVEFDYYQYTHGGILGTSRPAHYTVLHDENEMTPDSIQALSYGLAHSFARATRSVSIPAPVYYADIVCAKRAIHFDPTHNLGGSDTASQASGAGPPTLQQYKDAWSPINNAQSGVMYWM